MASCAKCGKHPLRKNRHGVFNCGRCGPRRKLPEFRCIAEAAP